MNLLCSLLPWNGSCAYFEAVELQQSFIQCENAQNQVNIQICHLWPFLAAWSSAGHCGSPQISAALPVYRCKPVAPSFYFIMNEAMGTWSPHRDLCLSWFLTLFTVTWGEGSFTRQTFVCWTDSLETGFAVLTAVLTLCMNIPTKSLLLLSVHMHRLVTVITFWDNGGSQTGQKNMDNTEHI